MLPVSSSRRLLMLALAVLVAAAIASPAFTQTTGMVKGRVFDEKNQPVEGAKITITPKDGQNRTYTVTSNKKGEFAQVGLQPGAYTATAEKAKVGSQSLDVRVRLNESEELTFKLVYGNTAAGKEEALTAAIKASFDAGVAASTAGDYDTAIAKFQEAIAGVPKCSECYYNVGLAQAQKKDYAKAEEAFKKSIELKDNVDAHNGLATIYNTQKRFDEASAESKLATDLAGAGAGGGGGTVSTLYNAGVIAWNAGKAEEAKAKFEEAIKLDPNHAESHYQLGMCLVNMGKLVEAGAEFDLYLKLAPTGQYAAQAKAISAQLPKK